MLAVVVLAGVVGLASGGRPAALRDVRLRWVGTLVAGLLAQVGADLAAARGLLAPPVVTTVVVASLALVLAFVGANRRVPGMWLVGVGFVLNAAVIVANGAMPVDPAAVAELGVTDPDRIVGKHELLTPATRLRWLADVIPVTPLRSVLSVGDLVLAGGVVRVAVALLHGDDGAEGDTAAARSG